LRANLQRVPISAAKLIFFFDIRKIKEGVANFSTIEEEDGRADSLQLWHGICYRYRARRNANDS
jgi:hypothetical protein